MTEDRGQTADGRGQRIDNYNSHLSSVICPLSSALLQLFLFTILGFLLFFYGSVNSFAQELVNPDSYRHDSRVMPEWEQIDDLANIPLLNTEIRQVASKYPSTVADRYGNKTIYMEGKPVLQIDRTGDMTYFINGQKSYKTTPYGMLIRNFLWDNRGRCTVENEWGEVLEREQYGLGSKLLQQFDSKDNLTHTYEYDSSGTGYWEYNLATRICKRFEDGSPTEERRGDKSGPIIAYWKKEGDNLWRIEKTSRVINDLDKDKILGVDELQWEVVDGDRHKYDSLGTEVLETYDSYGNLKISYEWQDHRLQKVVNHLDGTYEKYGEFGVFEEGVISSQGEETASWKHQYKGSRHERAYELMLDPVTGVSVYSGKYMVYSADNNVEETRLTVNNLNIEWLKPLYQDSGVADLQTGDDILLEDYVYFYEVKNLSAQELKEFFHTTDELAENIYNVIQENKDKGKADAGMFAKVSYALPDNAVSKQSKCLAAAAFFDINNTYSFSISGNDPSYTDINAKLLAIQAESCLNNGDNERVLELCSQFQENYVKDSDDFNSGIGRLYFEVLLLKIDALKKAGKAQEAGEARQFVIDNFTSLASQWGSEYVRMMDSLMNS